MMADTRTMPDDLLTRFRQGMVIPAMPLALDQARRFDPRHQRALVRYYIDAGAGGLAVGVHTTQFAIRDREIGLFEPVLRHVSTTIDDWCEGRGRAILKVAGVCGRRNQALREADLARGLGYHAALVSLGAYADDAETSVADLVAHCGSVGEILPILGFYLQPAVGGRILPYGFWRAFAELDSVIGIKIAPFNRYQTLDVVRAVQASGRSGSIALYTGNDDHIVDDLLTPFVLGGSSTRDPVRIVGGLLGQWAVWTKRAVEMLDEIHVAADGGVVPSDLLMRGVQLTDANGAIFDAANGFAGCIPGIHEVLRRQGLLAGRWCLDPDEVLSPGQLDEIDRVCTAYPNLTDDAFVRENLPRWLA